MCRTQPSVAALLYLQTSLSSVTNHHDEDEAAAYRRCMQHLLSAGDGGHDDDMADSMTEDTMARAVDGDDAVMASSQDFAFGDAATSPVDRRTWEQRSVTFSALLEFFPSALQQPKESLLDNIG
jgi:hypothetical protein